MRDHLPVAPSMDLAVAAAAPAEDRCVSGRLLFIAGLAVLLGLGGGLAAKALLSLIALITNAAFHARLSWSAAPIDAESVGKAVLVIPIAGAVVIGLMARYGSPAIRGHGIPEVMDRVLHGGSRIAPRLLFLKPLSAAVAIGTGGPFGAEGPIIATGGALGSTVGSALRLGADERKTLLAAGAAAGMSATFGTPVSAVLLSVELLLFEYRARSLIPVALAAAAANAARLLFIETRPAFQMPALAEPSWTALVFYTALGCVMGLVAVAVTKAVYAVEDAFERLPLHWMWWPALGATAVGAAGYVDPRVLGVGYEHIEGILSGGMALPSLGALVALKFAAWSVYLGSGTSGGTLAPLFIIGGGLGALAGSLAAAAWPALGISVPAAALIGMAALFAGASHALLASVVFAFEATRQPAGLLPLLAGCSAAYGVSLYLMSTSIMTEKLARRGAVVRTEYDVDFLSRVRVCEVMSTPVTTVDSHERVDALRLRLTERLPESSHQGFPVVTRSGALLGVITRRDIHDPQADPNGRSDLLVKRPPAVTHQDNTLREAADHMVRAGVGRLPVLERASGRLIGIITRSDLLEVHARRLGLDSDS